MERWEIEFRRVSRILYGDEFFPGEWLIVNKILPVTGLHVQLFHSLKKIKFIIIRQMLFLVRTQKIAPRWKCCYKNTIN